MDGGSDAFAFGKHVATLRQDGNAFTVTWRASGRVDRFSSSRWAREAIQAAEVPWGADGLPEL